MQRFGIESVSLKLFLTKFHIRSFQTDGAITKYSEIHWQIAVSVPGKKPPFGAIQNVTDHPIPKRFGSQGVWRAWVHFKFDPVGE
jgi:hypothetical protein